MLSLHQLVENGDLTVCLDNEALYVKSLNRSGNRANYLGLPNLRYDITTRTLKIKNPEFEHLNGVCYKSLGLSGSRSTLHHSSCPKSCVVSAPVFDSPDN